MKTAGLYLVGFIFLIIGALVAVNLLLYLLYWVVIIALFYPIYAYVLAGGLTALVVFFLGRAVIRQETVYRLPR